MADYLPTDLDGLLFCLPFVDSDPIWESGQVVEDGN